MPVSPYYPPYSFRVACQYALTLCERSRRRNENEGCSAAQNEGKTSGWQKKTKEKESAGPLGLPAM
jgi:hypothetical protein